jgi:polyketide biosynthesis acyl carrier protein
MITEEQIFESLKKFMLKAIDDLEIDEIDYSKTMRELGANSMDEIEITSRVIRELRIKVPLEALSEVNTLGELMAVLLQHANANA